MVDVVDVVDAGIALKADLVEGEWFAVGAAAPMAAKAGRRRANVSAEVPGRGCSSRAHDAVGGGHLDQGPRRIVLSSMAAAARFWLSAA